MLAKSLWGTLFILCVVALIPPLYPPRDYHQPPDSIKNPGLISDTTGMETAWDFPHNPLTDSTLHDDYLSRQIKLGFRLFTETPTLSRFSVNELSCNNCHLNAGQRERAMPLAGVAAAFPEYNKRAGRIISLEDRIVDCFRRSIDAINPTASDAAQMVQPAAGSDEVLAIAAYITWLSSGYAIGERLPWRGRNSIPADNLIPVDSLDKNRGRDLYNTRCMNCHGNDGQGVQIGDKKAGPLWGDSSWNDGAGAARLYTLAGMFMFAMPYNNTGTLTIEEAQEIAAFITSQPRPAYPFKDKDYPGQKIPSDAVYYLKGKK